MKDKTTNIKAFVKEAKKGNYYNIFVEVDGMTFEVEAKWLNNKQKALLRYKLAKVVGGDNNVK